jgi:branched-chain amino acid transport system permease protein
MGSIPGVIVGTVALITLPDMLREFVDFRIFIFGLLLVIMMIARPEGFIPSRRMKMELHHGEEHHKIETETGGSA